MFKIFPEFSKLTLEDKLQYEELIKDYPPLADLSFAMLMTWWNSLGTMAVSQLNKNLVISYLIPGDEEHSGLGFVGYDNIDESVCALFDYLKEKGDRPRLVHVPEFVISRMKYADTYRFKDEREYDECIISIKELNAILDTAGYKRPAFNRLMQEKPRVRQLDLRSTENRQILKEAHQRWQQKGTINETVSLASEFVPTLIDRHRSLGIENLCLFIGGRLQAFMLYQKPYDKRFIILDTFKMNTVKSQLFDLAVFMFAKWFGGQGIEFANIDVDLGLPILRNAKLKLGPANFFRKYTVEPR
jgi:hypothetical protein